MRRAFAILVTAFSTGCVPYAVGSTAQPVPVGDWVSSNTIYFIPAGIDRMNNQADTTRSVSLVGNDVEARLGLDDRSDIGVRAPGLIGIVVNYKRRLTGIDDQAAAWGVIAGGGIVNAGAHAHIEATLIYSARQNIRLTPYGGVRVMQVFPLTRDAARDRVTAGVFLGMRIGRLEMGVSPELGVFYDHSVLGLRKRNIIVVPSFTLHGADFFKIFRRD